MSTDVLTLPANDVATSRTLSADRVPIASGSRFTIDGDDALETHLATTCQRIAAGLRGLLPARSLEAVLLGGGYGRGEGGVWRTPDGDRAYNDLEFYVFLRGNRHVNERRFGRALHVFGEILTPQAGLDVEFRIAALAELAAARPSMFSYDLICGHRTIVGNDSVLASCGQHRDASAIPIEEATRLLMNRCTGLLLARERLARRTFTPADADFVGRNIAKAQLGAGDAVLTAFGQYHWSVRERLRRLEEHAVNRGDDWTAALLAQHTIGTEFKLHPQRCTATRATLIGLHADVSALCRTTWLWLESRRLGVAFKSVQGYALDPRVKCSANAPLRTALINAKVLGPRVLIGSETKRHPRERILNTLPVLLWEPDALHSPEWIGHLQRNLRTPATDFCGLMAAYRHIWQQVN